MISPNRMASRLLAACSVFSLLWVACGEPPLPPLTDTDILARVGDEEVTVADFQGYLDRLPEQARSQVQTNRLLQAIVDEKLIVAECRRLGLDKSADYRELIQLQTRRLSLAELYRREGIVRGEPTDEDLEKFFASGPYSKRVRFSLLMVKDPQALVPLMDKLRAGADFEKLSMEHSQDPRILMRQADMGYHRWGETMPSHEALTQIAFTMEPGQLAGPLAVADGHFLLKVTDVHPVSLDQERETVQQLWQQRNLARQLSVYCDSLLVRFSVEFEDVGLEALWSAMQPAGVADGAGRGQVVARLSEGELSLEACLRMLTAAGDAPTDRESLRRLLQHRICREVLMLQEIGRLDLVNSVEVKRGLAEARRKAMLDLIRRRIESDVAPPSLNLVRLHFDANRQDYRESGQVNVRRLSVPDRAAGEAVIAQIESATDTTALFDRFAQLTYPMQTGDSEISQALQGEPASIQGPIPEGTGFVVLQILERRESRVPDFTEVQERATRDLLAQERSEVFERYLEELRLANAENVEIHLDRVEQLGRV